MSWARSKAQAHLVYFLGYPPHTDTKDSAGLLDGPQFTKLINIFLTLFPSFTEAD
jgi:hypothetical protein